MKRLSSPFTMVFKYVFPSFVLGLYGTGLVDSFSGSTRLIYLCILFPLLAVGLLLVCIPLKSVYITKNSFFAGNGLWKKEIPFADVSDIKTTHTYCKPGSYPFVSLHMKSYPPTNRFITFFPSLEMRRNPTDNAEQIRELMKEFSQPAVSSCAPQAVRE